MSIRRIFFFVLVAIAFLLATGIQTTSLNSNGNTNNTVGLVAGRNVNMVSGTEWPGGDPWLQRQNEPSIAVSTRNALHLLAGSNDYRSIDAYFEDELPGYALESSARDAWLGVYVSYDGGESWKSTLLPGYIHADTTPPGAPASPLLGFEAAADPVVRAGTNGLFYYSGITFNRGQRGLGQVFVARFVDNNNKETGAIEYIDTKIVDVGNSGHFIDKPYLAADIPRYGAATTELASTQTVPCGNVFIVYTSFMGDLEVDEAHSKLMFSMSSDCGETWSKPSQITDAGQPYQGAIIAIDPRDGRPYVVWRRFAKDKTDAIMMCWAEQKGKETMEGYWHDNKIKFSKPMVLAEIDPYDQPTSGITFRTNDYPAMTIDSAGVIYVTWSQRGWGPDGEGKIVMMTSPDGGQTWVGPALVDGSPDSGYQFMPALTIGPGGKVMALWYDQRFDECVEHFNDYYIEESYPIRHTIDVRAAEVFSIPNAFGYFSDESIQVSRYPWIFTVDDNNNIIGFEQLQWNMPNLRMFGGGKVPFMGDYIDITPSPMFVPEGDGWAYNTDPASRPVYHAVWTDNRDVRLAVSDDVWWDFVAPGEDCGALDENKTGIRNQNIYTSRITEGIIAGSPGNTKSLNINRAFVVFVKNATDAERDLILEIDPSSEATAYFMKYGESVGDTLLVTALPHSSVSATVMVDESPLNEYATVRINVKENSTLLTYILLNPDSTNPGIEPHDGYDPDTPHVGSNETRTPHVGSRDLINWDYSVDSPHVGSRDETSSPHVGSNRNDDWCTPHVGSDDDIRSGSTIHVGNGHVILSNIINPHVGSGDFPDRASIPPNTSMTDIVWTVENRGNTTSTYSLNSFPNYDYDPAEIAVQLIVYKVYTTPTALGCELLEQEHHELILSQTSPHVGSNGRESNTASIASQSEPVPWYFGATFSIPPKGTGEGEVEYKVILRYMDKDTTDDIELDPEDQGIFVDADAPEILDGVVQPSVTALVITTRTQDLDNGIVNTLYNETLEVEGGYGNYVWSLGGDAATWLDIVGTPSTICNISGTPSTAGIYALTITVEDTDPVYNRPPLTFTKILSITVYDPLIISTTTLPDGTIGVAYDQTLTATGGHGDYTWSLVGSLPDGLSLSSGGVINSGAPTNSGTFDFTVEVADTSNPPQTAQQALSINVIPPHTVSMPNIPNGPTMGYVNTSYLFSTGGSVCSWGDDVEYRFDWDDGNQSSWSTSTSASHSWDTAGTYNVTAQARCASDTNIVSGWSGALTVTINAPDFEIAYVYSTDTTTANSYKDFLEGQGYPTSLIHMDSIVDGIFADYGLILIGTDTGSLGTWGDSGKVDAINNSGKSIIGLGEGGYAFFGKLNLAIGWGHGWHGPHTDMIVLDSSHDVFNTPNNLGVTTGQTISIYTSSGNVGIYMPDPQSNVVLFGEVVNDPDDYILVQEDSRYLLWGWTASPDSMTVIGKDLFENVVNLMAVILFYKDNWDVPGDLAGWQPNTAWTVVDVVDTGGNPGGYLSTQNEPGYSYAGALTQKTELTDNYSSASTTKISFDLNWFNGNINTLRLRFRYKDATYNGWTYLLSNPSTMNVWNTYTVTFDPNWTDSEATAAGWTQESTSPSFSATMGDVYTCEVRVIGGGSMSLGIDNFTRLDLK